MGADSQDIIDFWFKELRPKQWFEKDLQLDTQISDRFGAIHQQACRAELYDWRETPLGALAEIIVLDQFSRNIYRDQAQSFAQDTQALILAQEVVRRQDHLKLKTVEKSFLYMPYMHSESQNIHEQALKLYAGEGLENYLKFEQRHLAILKRFDRYPHRNQILNRPSTKEEIQFLQTPDSSF